MMKHIVVVICVLAIVLLSLCTENPTCHNFKEGGEFGKTLIISPMGKRGIDVLKRNVSMISSDIDVFVCIYDGSELDHALSHCGRIVNISRSSGCKADHWVSVPLELTRKYDYVWLMDEDIDLSEFDWSKFKSIVQAYRPLVIQPSVKPSRPGGRSTDHPFLRWKSVDFDAQEVHLAEVQTCLVSTKLWEVIHHRLVKIDRRSIWGIDNFWSELAWLCCKQVGCGPLVVYSTSVIHLDFRSMDNTECKRGCMNGCRPIDNIELDLMNKLLGFAIRPNNTSRGRKASKRIYNLKSSR